MKFEEKIIMVPGPKVPKRVLACPQCSQTFDTWELAKEHEPKHAELRRQNGYYYLTKGHIWKVNGEDHFYATGHFAMSVFFTADGWYGQTELLDEDGNSYHTYVHVERLIQAARSKMAELAQELKAHKNMRNEEF